jgi:phospholipid/cholesterol/gamma-HCH transport system ATP-binding protein
VDCLPLRKRDNDSVVVVDGLKAAFRGTTILERVDLEISPGEILCIVGGSGCGKSTLLKHMIGLLRPAAGRVFIDGVDIAAADEALVNRIREGIGVLFQSDALLGSLTLAENIALPLSRLVNFSPEAVRLIVRMKLSMVNLAGYENHYPAELSGGMRKRGALARAMVLDPRVLFFDEPSAGLDPLNADELGSLILALNAALGTTMVIVSHHVELVLRLAHRIIMLDRDEKGIIAAGTPQALRDSAEDPRVREFLFRTAPGV